MVAGRPEELHFVYAELDADVVGGAGFAEAGAYTVEFAMDGRGFVVHGTRELTSRFGHLAAARAECRRELATRTTRAFVANTLSPLCGNGAVPHRGRSEASAETVERLAVT